MTHIVAVQSGAIVERQLCLFEDEPGMGLSETQRRFADEYIANGNNGTRAYMAARPEVSELVARAQASKWLNRNERIRAYIRARCGGLARAALLRQEEVIWLYREIAARGLGELPTRKTFRTAPKQTDAAEQAEAAPEAAQYEHALVFEPNLSAASSAATGLAKILGIGLDEVIVHNHGAALGELTQEERATLREMLERREQQALAAAADAEGKT